MSPFIRRLLHVLKWQKFMYLPYRFVVFGCLMLLMVRFVHMERRCRHVLTACSLQRM